MEKFPPRISPVVIRESTFNHIAVESTYKYGGAVVSEILSSEILSDEQTWLFQQLQTYWKSLNGEIQSITKGDKRSKSISPRKYPASASH